MEKEQLDALERVVNQIGGGYDEEFYKDLAKVKEYLITTGRCS